MTGARRSATRRVDDSPRRTANAPPASAPPSLPGAKAPGVKLMEDADSDIAENEARGVIAGECAPPRALAAVDDAAAAAGAAAAAVVPTAGG